MNMNEQVVLSSIKSSHTLQYFTILKIDVAW